MPNFKISHLDPRKMTMRVTDCDVALMIALRRTVMSKVPTVAMAFDSYDPELQDIEIVKNTGCFHNEWIAHRLSLIPMFFDRTEIETFDPDRYVFELSATVTGRKNVDVTTADITVYVDGKQDDDLAKRLFPTDPVTGDHILITRLRWSPDLVQETLHVRCKARLGTGSQHARWSPVSKCVYVMTIDEEAAAFARSRLDAASVRVFDSLERQRHVLTDARGNPNTFDFYVETECGLTPVDVIDMAFGILANKCDAIADGNFQSEEAGDMTIVHLPNEDKTIAAFLQAMLYEMHKDRIDFVGYCQSHPLHDSVMMKVRASSATFRECVADVSKWLKEAHREFSDLKK